MKRKRLVLFLVLAVIAGGIWYGYWRLTSEPPSSNDGVAGDTLPSANPTGETKAETEEEKERRKLLGVWQDEYQGKRTMTVNKDGTATMAVELSGFQAILAAPKLRFDMKWSLDGKKMTKKTVGGEPANKVNLILNTMGDTAVDTILELTDNRLLLLDKDGKTKYDWKRVKKGE